MNRRQLVIAGTVVAALAVFAGGAYLFTQTDRHGVAEGPAAGAPLVRAHSPVLGPQDARVTIVEFFDPACEACRAFHPVVKQIMAQYPDKVRLVLRYATFHEGSADAVRILETARLQGVFQPVLEALFEDQPVWAPHDAPQLDKAWEAAARAGLDIDRAKRDANLPAISTTLAQDAADIAAVGVTQTPTFYVNGRPLIDFGAQQLLDLVNSEVEAP